MIKGPFWPVCFSLWGVLSDWDSLVETGCIRGREHTANLYQRNPLRRLVLIGAFALFLQGLAQRSKACKRLCIIVCHGR